jgi:glutathione peroxidase
MNKNLLFTFLMFLLILGYAQTKPSIHSYTATSIDDEIVYFSKYAGKKILIVNTASFCQYTPQFTSLQLLYHNFHQYNFEIVGFPCNDFGSQDPHSDSVINSFCTGTYSITFPMMSKVKIVAGDTAPIYKWLQRANLNGKMNTSVAWNFGKFLINESGNLVRYLPSSQNPADTALTNWILSPSSTLGIRENMANSDFYEFSSGNPVSGNFVELKINSQINEPLKVSVFTVDGKVVKELLYSKSSEKSILIDVSKIENGLYFLKLESGAKELTKQVIISR